MSFNIKILTTKALIISALLLTFSPTFAQYKLELEWQKEPGGGAFNIRSLDITKDDSVIILSGSELISNDYRKFMKISASDGRILSTKDNAIVYNFMKLSKDNSILVCGNEDNNSVEVYDFLTLEQRMSFKSPVMIKGISFCEPQMKAVVCSDGYTRIYDINKKEMVREYKLGGINAKLTDNGKYIVYTTSYQNFPLPGYRMSIIDTSGQEIKNIETTSPNFAFTIDGKNLIYFDKDATHLMNLETMTELENFPNTVAGYGQNPACIDVSLDGKFILLGTNYLEFATRKTFIVSSGSWLNFKLSNDANSVYSSSGNLLQKFIFKTSNTVLGETTTQKFTIQTNLNTLILSSQSAINPNLLFSIVGIDGKLIRQILPDDIQINNNSASIDISSLATGAYLLQVSSNSEEVFSSKFMKVD